MERRRRHEECRAEGCEVVVGRNCGVVAWKGRKGATDAGMRRFDHCMRGIDPRLVVMAVLIVAFSFLASVGLGVRMGEKMDGCGDKVYLAECND